MAVKSQIPGQMNVFGGDFSAEKLQGAETVQDPTAKVAFGRMLKTPLYDVFGDYDITAVSQAERDQMAAANIGGTLLNTGSKKGFVVDRIALTPHEYRLVMRTPNTDTFGATAVATTLDAADETDDERHARAARSGLHVLEGALERMGDHRQLMEARRAEINAVYKEARSPGYAHYSEKQMVEWLNSAWQEFGVMLDAAREQRADWDDAGRAQAEAILIAHLTTGPQQDRVKNWKGWLSLSNRYLGFRIGLFKNRERKISQSLKDESSVLI